MDPVARLGPGAIRYLSGVVRMVSSPPIGYRPAMKRDILKPYHDVEKRAGRLLRAIRKQKLPANVEDLAERLHESLRAAPQEFFSPADEPDLIDDLERHLLAFKMRVVVSGHELERGLVVLIRSAGDARQWWGRIRLTDPRARRHDVLGAAIARAYEELTGEKAKVYVDAVSGVNAGSFVDWISAIAPLICLPDHEARAIAEYRRTRRKSRYKSVRAEVGKG